MKKMYSEFRRFLREEDGMEAGETVMLIAIAAIIAAALFALFKSLWPTIKTNIDKFLNKDGSEGLD